MMRSAAAVVAGIIVTFVLVMVTTYLATVALAMRIDSPPTSGYIVLNLLGGLIAGACGGATAAWVAARRPHGHVIAVATAILLMSLPTLLSAPAPGQPSWYPLVLSVLGPVSVLLGGWLMIRRKGLA